MEAMSGPQWHQLPMLMTHDEVGKLTSGDWSEPVGKVRERYQDYAQNGSDSRRLARSGDRVNGLLESMHTRGYDETHPLEVVHSGRASTLADGHHRATAAAMTGQQLVPVKHYTSWNQWNDTDQ